MNEVKSLRLQLERKVLVLKQHINDIYGALNELKTITEIVFNITPYNREDVIGWLQSESFELDGKGFVVSTKLTKLEQDQQLPSTALAHHWPAKQKNNLDLIHRYYALRNMGEVLQPIRERLNGATIIYYQDIEHNASVAYPYIATTEIVEPDFQWAEYFACVSVNPENNPERKIRWSPNNIDYAGEGLIAIASIPFYEDDKFIGVWSIDIPLHTIHQNCIEESLADEQVNFIVDYDGVIITHPSIEAKIDKEKGSVIQLTLSELGQSFKRIDLKKLISEQSGSFEILDDHDRILIVVYHIIPEIEWIVVTTVPKEVMFESVRVKIALAFDKMRGRKLPDVIDFAVGEEMRHLVESYNEMAKIVAFNQEKREIAQKQALEAQRTLNDELENLVKIRTLELHKLNQELARQAQTDSLTGLANRRHFFQLSYQALKLLKREGRVSSLLMIDIDHFKSINDTHGHNIGDDVLVNLAKSIAALLRDGDILARFGGEEFLVLAPNTQVKNVLLMAERIRSSAQRLSSAMNLQITVSIGAAEFTDNLEDALEKADAALYIAKRNGRNRVESYRAPPE